MNDFLFVHIYGCPDQLCNTTSCLDISQSFTSFDHVIQCEVGTQSKYDIYVLFVFEIRLELNYTIIVQRAMNFDLGHELSKQTYFLFGSTFVKRGLGDDFGSKLKIGFKVSDLVAFGKPALT